MLGLHPSRQTLANIQKTQAFTVGIPGASQEVVADYLGCVTAKVTPDKFEKSGLHAVPSEYVNAPVIEEFKLTLECKVVKMEQFGSHIQVMGQIMNTLADEDILNAEGGVDIAKLDPILVDPSADTYHRVGECVGKIFHDGLAMK